ncbi:hypothetical protein [Stenotrophomonas sp. CASM110]|uniref:hypothetical protein n=1 Tax=Stenotrophomonas sp. CASM110 TaxID=3111510 RepID=UPI003BF7E41F
MKKIVLSLIACVVLAGCATRQISSEQAQPVPAERVFAFNGIGDTASGQVIVTRDVGAVGGACPLALYIDGTLAAHLQRGESVSLPVPAGNRISAQVSQAKVSVRGGMNRRIGERFPKWSRRVAEPRSVSRWPMMA